MDSQLLCPCHSQKPYRACCKRYHEGSPPENALALMRSRYSAYALHLADYIMQTTHPDNPNFSSNIAAWKESILAFSRGTQFEGLQILEFIDDAQSAYVTFTAILKQGARDATFTEKSHFLKVGERWLYRGASCKTNKTG